jgi:hypothetical protein
MNKVSTQIIDFASEFGLCPQDHVEVRYHRDKDSPRGGVTQVRVFTEDGLTIDSIAICSLADNFEKKKGVASALGRAKKVLLDGIKSGNNMYQGQPLTCVTKTVTIEIH